MLALGHCPGGPDFTTAAPQPPAGSRNDPIYMCRRSGSPGQFGRVNGFQLNCPKPKNTRRITGCAPLAVYQPAPRHWQPFSPWEAISSTLSMSPLWVLAIIFTILAFWQGEFPFRGWWSWLKEHLQPALEALHFRAGPWLSLAAVALVVFFRIYRI